MIEPSAEGCRYAGFVRIGRVRRQHLRVLLDRSPATGFVDDDIDVEIATLLDLRKGEDGSRCYRVTVTPTGASRQTVEVKLSVPANVLSDDSGNANFESEEVSGCVTVP